MVVSLKMHFVFSGKRTMSFSIQYNLVATSTPTLVWSPMIMILSFSPFSDSRSSRLIRAFSACDWNLPKLVIFLKWFCFLLTALLNWFNSIRFIMRRIKRNCDWKDLFTFCRCKIKAVFAVNVTSLGYFLLQHLVTLFAVLTSNTDR